MERLNKLNPRTDEDYLTFLDKAKEINLNLNHFYSFFNEEFIVIEEQKLKNELAKIRIELTNFQDKLNKNYSKLLNYVEKKYKLKKSDLLWLNHEIIFEILKNEKSIIPEKNIALIVGDNFYLEIKGKKVDEIKTYLEQNDPQNKKIAEIMKKNSFKGLPCNKGIVKGKVIKIAEKNYEKLKGLKDYILVIPMTRPEIAPYLKNAKGIITDEGGITCHASIVSRELDVPCIVGTKIATNVLNDGDKVLMNANKGEVEILNKNGKN